MRYTGAPRSSSQRYFAPGQLQFITSSVYRRRKLFDSPRLRGVFVDVLRQLRRERGFLLIGWVLMPEHLYLLIKPQPAESTSALLQELKKRSAQQIVSILSENQQRAWRRNVLAGLRLPPTVHAGSLPAEKMGVYMGIFNFFITIPEITASLFFGWVMLHLLHNNRLAAVLAGGFFLILAAVLMKRVVDVALVEAPSPKTEAVISG